MRGIRCDVPDLICSRLGFYFVGFYQFLQVCESVDFSTIGKRDDKMKDMSDQSDHCILNMMDFESWPLGKFFRFIFRNNLLFFNLAATIYLNQ